MEAGFHVARLSALYETEPIDVDEDHDHYLNMVAEVNISNVSPSQMLARMIRIEYLLGRRHKYLMEPRTIDLDLLFYGDTLVDTEQLTVPHKKAHERRFVLVPMAELDPQFEHPSLKKTVSELLSELNDNSEVVRWSPDPGDGDARTITSVKVTGLN